MMNLRSLAQAAYTALSASADDCGAILSFLALHEMAPPQKRITKPPNGSGDWPHDESVNGASKLLLFFSKVMPRDLAC